MVAEVLVPGFIRRTIARFLEIVTPPNKTVRTRWLVEPDTLAGEQVCLFVTFAPGGRVLEHSIYHARAWANAGFMVVLLIITDRYESEIDTDDLSFSHGVLLRENRGYDFGAWASALERLPELRDASLVALANDSVYGPLNTFQPMLERVRTLDADVIGTTESTQFTRHFQSFSLFFKPRALKSEGFWTFWQNVRAGGRIVAIYRYELGFVKAMERAGLRCVALFPSSSRRNPSYRQWRQLILNGFPYLKTSLFRLPRVNMHLSDWKQLLHERGYDPKLVERHLDGRDLGQRISPPPRSRSAVSERPSANSRSSD